METQEAETKKIETQEMETQALEDTMTSIRSEVETVFSTDQINLNAAALFDRVVATIDLCLVHDASEKLGSAGRAAVNLKYFNSILVLLNDLKLLHEQPRNVFREIHMGEFTLLGLLSPLTLCTIKSISVGSGGIQYLHMSGQPGVDGVPETALPVVSNGDDCVKNEITETNLANYIPRFSRNCYKLVRRSQIVFREIQLKEREMMLILSCTTPIIVHNVRGEEGAVFIAGQVHRASIEWICKGLDVKFDSNEPDGVSKPNLLDREDVAGSARAVQKEIYWSRRTKQCEQDQYRLRKAELRQNHGKPL